MNAKITTVALKTKRKIKKMKENIIILLFLKHLSFGGIRYDIRRKNKIFT